MRKSESGQALLIVLLVMAVGLTMGLSVISRSTTDIRISRQEKESARAFSAAEAGIEQALLSSAGVSGNIGGIDYSVTPETQGGGTEFDFGGGKFAAGDTQTVWLIEHTGSGELGGDSFPVGGQITVCWGEDTADKMAIEASVIYKTTTGEFRVTRGAYDADYGRGNGFDPADNTGGGNCGNLAFAENINIIPASGTLYALRLRLLYNDDFEPLAVSGSADFPSQGKCYVSTATVQESGITRKVRQCQSHKVPPAIFDYVLFSEGSLTK